MRRQAQKLQHHLVACREKWAGRQSRAHAAPQGEERAATPQWVALNQARDLAQDFGSLPKRQACTRPSR